MKIENIIDDIIKDMLELRDNVEEQFRKENPILNFSVSSPGIEELTTIKSIELSIDEDNTRYCLSAQIHTHNGNRVFENESREIINNQPVRSMIRHPFQDRFVNLLRDIIKKKKNKMKSANKHSHFYNDNGQYAMTT